MGRKKKYHPPSFLTRGVNNHYVCLYDDMLNSVAYLALPATAKEVYTMLLQEYKGTYTGNRIICPYSTFQEKGMRKDTVSKAIKTLVVFGFIEYEPGGLARSPNIYHFVDSWKNIKKEDVHMLKKQLKACPKK